MTDENTQTAPKELREALERAEARAEEAEKTASTATSELRQFKASVMFEKSGLTPKHAELFLKTNPEAEVTPDAVGAFAEEYGLSGTVVEAAPEAKPDTADPGKNLASFGEAAGSSAGGSTPAAKPKLSAEDFQKLLVDNPQEAAKAYMDGTAPRNDRNVQARDLVKKGIIDH